MRKLDKFSQLVEDLVNGDFTLIQIQLAIRESIRRREDIPDGVKDLLAGISHDSGLIYKMFYPISNVIGALELAYRRGKDNPEKRE